MSVNNQFAKGVAWMAAGNWIEQAINFLVFIILARLLGAKSFGLIAMASTFVVFAEFLVRETFSEILISREKPSDGHFNAAFWVLVAIGLAITGILLTVAPLIGRFFGEAEVTAILRAMSFVVILTAVTEVPVAILRRNMNFRILSLRAIAGVVVGGVVGIALALTGAGAWALAWQRVTVVVVNIVMAWTAVTWRPTVRFSRLEARDVLGFGAQVQGMRAAELALTQVPIVAIGAVFGAHAVGLFSFAWRLVENASFLLSTALRMVAQPAFASAAREGRDAGAFLVRILKVSSFIAFPAFMGLAVYAEPLLVIVFGEKWIEAAPILSVLSAIGAYICVEKIHLSFCLAAGKAGRITAISWVEVALAATIVGAFVFEGLMAATWGYIIVVLGVWLVRFKVVADLSGQGYAAIALVHVKPAIAAVAMGLGLLMLPNWGNGVTLILGTLAGIGVYTVLALIFMRERFENFSIMFFKTNT